MMTRMNALLRNEEGQGMTEYIIIVALIAIAAIGVITVFGQNLRSLFAASANALAGSESEDNKGKSDTEAKRKGLADFGHNESGDE